MTISALLKEALFEWRSHQSTALSLAIQLGWLPYIKSRFSAEQVESKSGRRLLDYTLRLCLGCPRAPDEDIVVDIIAAGGHPSHLYDGVSIWVRSVILTKLDSHNDFEALFRGLAETFDTFGISPSIQQ